MFKQIKNGFDIMWKKITKLIDVKSIVTLALTFTFIYLAVSQIINGDKFYDIFLMIMSFYFGVQTAKDKKEVKEEEVDVSRD